MVIAAPAATRCPRAMPWLPSAPGAITSTVPTSPSARPTQCRGAVGSPTTQPASAAVAKGCSAAISATSPGSRAECLALEDADQPERLSGQPLDHRIRQQVPVEPVPGADKKRYQQRGGDPQPDGQGGERPAIHQRDLNRDKSERPDQDEDDFNGNEAHGQLLLVSALAGMGCRSINQTSCFDLENH